MLAATVAALACTASSAVENQSRFVVGVRVLPRTTLEVRSVPSALTISADDVRRAYIDVWQPTRLEITNNSPDGYALLVEPTVRVFKAVLVRGAGPAALLGGDGGAIAERGQTGARLPLSLNFRFELAPHVVPGRYPWPLELAVRPLTDFETAPVSN